LGVHLLKKKLRGNRSVSKGDFHKNRAVGQRRGPHRSRGDPVGAHWRGRKNRELIKVSERTEGARTVTS